MSDGKYNYSLPFSDYMEEDSGKFAAVITKNQYAIEVGGFAHEGMVSDLIKKTRPDIPTDVWGNSLDPKKSYYDGNIMVLGYPQYVLVQLPKLELLSNDQFDCLKNILLEIKKYNDANHEVGYGRDYQLMVYGNGVVKVEAGEYQNNIDELIEQLSGYVSDEVERPNEVIIGTPFKGVLLKNNEEPLKVKNNTGDNYRTSHGRR